jgi:hypothetical protein
MKTYMGVHFEGNREYLFEQKIFRKEIVKKIITCILFSVYFFLLTIFKTIRQRFFLCCVISFLGIFERIVMKFYGTNLYSSARPPLYHLLDRKPN